MNLDLINEKAELVWICSLPGITTKQTRELLTLFGSPGGAWEAVCAGHCSKVVAENRKRDWMSWAETVRPRDLMKSLQMLDVKVAVLGERCYPELLKEIHDPPYTVFYRGSLPRRGTTGVAVVGSRKATPYGIEAALWLAGGLASEGVHVISGAAYGIDAAAHRGALDAGGFTVAILGCGPDVVYPRANRKLIEEIGAGGCLLSEYPPGTKPLKYRFPARNRLIAGMSRGVVVVEASEGSGALITADFAVSEGREVFAVPGRVFSGNSAGTHELIRQGALIVTSPRDVISELGLSAGTVPSDHGGSRNIRGIDRTMARAVVSGISGPDEIAKYSGIPVAEALAGLSRMEVQGFVRRGHGGRYYPTHSLADPS